MKVRFETDPTQDFARKPKCSRMKGLASSSHFSFFLLPVEASVIVQAQNLDSLATCSLRSMRLHLETKHASLADVMDIDAKDAIS